MKAKFLYATFSLLALAVIIIGSSQGRAASAGMGNTGAPGDTMNGNQPWVCATCHIGSNATVAISIDVQDMGGNSVTQYEGGQTYRVVVALDNDDMNLTRYGFQMVSLLDSDDGDVAGWSNPSNNAKIATASSTGRSYAEHKGPSSTSTFEVDWTAPDMGSGSVTMYVAGNAVNQNGDPSGDTGDNTSLQLSESGGASVDRLTSLGISDFSMYPNPVQSDLNVSLTAARGNDFELSVLNIAGQIVYYTSWNVTNGNNRERLELADIPKGRYYLKIEKDNKLAAFPFVKL